MPLSYFKKRQEGIQRKESESAQARREQVAALAAADSKTLQEFHLKEFEGLRAEILQTLTNSRDLERNVVFAVGVSLAWILTHKNLPSVVWFVPLALVILGIIRSLALLLSFGVYGEYVRLIEGSLTGTGFPQGWETFRKNRTLGIAWTSYIFWGTLLLGSIWLIICKHPVIGDPATCPPIIIQGAPGVQPSTAQPAPIMETLAEQQQREKLSSRIRKRR